MCNGEMVPIILSTVLLSFLAACLSTYGTYFLLGCFPSWYWSEANYIGYFLVVSLLGLIIWGGVSVKSPSTYSVAAGRVYRWVGSSAVVLGTFFGVYYLLFLYLSRTVALPFGPNTC